MKHDLNGGDPFVFGDAADRWCGSCGLTVSGLSLYAKGLEGKRFVRPSAKYGVVISTRTDLACHP